MRMCENVVHPQHMYRETSILETSTHTSSTYTLLGSSFRNMLISRPWICIWVKYDGAVSTCDGFTAEVGNGWLWGEFVPIGGS